MASEDPVSLIARLKRGDRAALAEVFAYNHDRLWRMVNFRMDRRLAGRIDPEDVLQEAFLAATARIERFAADQMRSPFAWLRIIVQQTLIDMHRHYLSAQKRYAAHEVPLASPGADSTAESLAIQLVGTFTTPTHAATRQEALQLVRHAIDTMEPIDREILALRHYEELENSEVAEILEIQPKAASIRYVRALRRLKEIMASIHGLGGESHV